MHTFFRHILESIFPPRADATVLCNETETSIARLYEPHQYESIECLSHFGEPIIRAAIHEAKFHYSQHAIALLASLLSIYAQEQPETVIFIPVPLSRTRERERGYNQVREILWSTKRLLPRLLLDDTLLLRQTHTVPQTTLDRTQRLTNVANAFIVHDPKAIVGRHFIIVDDVTTTGATLQAAKAALLPHAPASVKLLALAH